NVPIMISVIFGVSCGLAAAAGVLVAPINFIEVEMGYVILLKGFAAAVVGGFGSIRGAILGGLIVGIFETLGAGYISGNYKDIYAFLLMIVVLTAKPSGLLGYQAEMKA
ncbi:MAG: branched-chain amino acid ABC transporter permease, partial [bacterium]|nr:branched-chain amino acid ABC transporter permease [bacterium]